MKVRCPYCGRVFEVESAKGVFIVNLLKQKGPLRWREILKETGFSSRTVSKHLKRLIQQGVLEREVKTESYPPRVVYKLRKEPKVLEMKHNGESS